MEIAAAHGAVRDVAAAITIDAEPMDEFDCQYIQGHVATMLGCIKGVRGTVEDGRLIIRQSAGVRLSGQQVGEVLLASVRHEFPKLRNVRIEVIFDPAELANRAPVALAVLAERARQIADATEEAAQTFCECVGCSPFAPDHVCVITPERPPQCGRPYGMIKTGALYGYDDMSNIHHSRLQRGLNSFQVIQKGRCLDPLAGEWEGVNRRAAELTGGRTTRVLLHSLDSTPHTGCGCFRLVMFRTRGPQLRDFAIGDPDRPRKGMGTPIAERRDGGPIAIMEAGYAHPGPDGRTWRDLHYSLAGKQTDGIAGAALAYLRSGKFLRAHGGWASVVWVSPKIAEFMGSDLPPAVEVGQL